MTVHAWRRPFALHPLMAEAKRRMRQRRLRVAALLVALAGGALGGLLALHSTSHFVAKQPLGSALAKGPSAESGGRPSWGGDRFDELRFIPLAPFKIGIVLTNETSQPVTLTDVRAVLPHGSVIRQLGTALVAVNLHSCTTPSCPAPPGGISQPRSNGGLRPRALQLAPGEAAGVQLNFRFVGCPQARHGSLRNVSRVEVSYRNPVGAIIHQRLRLTTSTLKIDTLHPCSR